MEDTPELCLRSSSSLQPDPSNVTVTFIRGNTLKIDYWDVHEDKNGRKDLVRKVETIQALKEKKDSVKITSQRRSVGFTIPKNSSLTGKTIFNKPHDVNEVVHLLKGKSIWHFILDEYVSILIREYNANSQAGIFKKTKRGTRIDYVSCRFLMVSEDSKVVNNIDPHFKYSPKTDLRNSIVFAPLSSCYHYFLVVYNFPMKTFSIYDSARQYLSDDIRFHHALNLWKILVARMFSFRDYSELEKMKEEWTCIIQTECAQQKDNKSCGYFVASFIKHLLNGNPEKCNEPISLDQLKEIRKQIAQAVLRTESGKTFLNIITR